MFNITNKEMREIKSIMKYNFYLSNLQISFKCS